MIQKFFNIGDKVKCVDPRDNLNTEEIYTITNVKYDGEDSLVSLKEVPKHEYFHSRFKLV